MAYPSYPPMPLGFDRVVANGYQPQPNRGEPAAVGSYNAPYNALRNSHFSFGSTDKSLFGKYHFNSRIFPSSISSDFPTHPGFSIFKKNVEGKDDGHKIAIQIGEKGSGFRNRGHEAQDFYKLRDELSSRRELFRDPEFDAVDSSLYYCRSPGRSFRWMRPTEIVRDPQFFVSGASRFDIVQGELGDCWVLAAIANLTMNKFLFCQVVPCDQGFQEKYAGIFHFRFWQYGRWIDVVIDDRLPTINGELVFLHSSHPNEFWSALMEKAYAKLHGSYEALKGGGTSEAMEDFTGGVSEMFELKEAPTNLFQIMIKAAEKLSLMACAIEADPRVVDAKTSLGLIKGHAYSITKVKYVDISTPNMRGKMPLVRLRNPWGNDAEWRGPWSDQSSEWRFIPDSEKKSIGLTFDNDGEFWMSFKDFESQFDRLEICNINPDTLPAEAGPKTIRWEMSFFEGEWVRGVTAGGCRNYADTFHYNPQYTITLKDPDVDCDSCTVIIALMQKNRRVLKKHGKDTLTIGFAVYDVPSRGSYPKPLDSDFFRTRASVARCPSFVNLREVTCRFQLPPGVYVIVPSTFEPNQQGEFILRVFSERENNLQENDDEVDLCEKDSRIKTARPRDDASLDERAKQSFRKIAGEDMEIDWMELKEILDFSTRDIQRQGFSKDVCRSMIAMMDVDRSGKLGFEEFRKLWLDIKDWQAVFKIYEKDNAGYLSAFELRQALYSAGYRLNNHILNILCHRYASKDGKIAFDDFMMCAVRLKAMIEIFHDRSGNGKHGATFNLEDWIETTLYS